MTLEFQVMAWDRHPNVSGLNWLMGSQPSALDNWMINDIPYEQTIKKKPAQIRFNWRRRIFAKINDNINLDSAIAGINVIYI